MFYWVHRLCHILPYLKEIHWKHHKYVNNTQPKWMWQNIFLYSDDWNGTLDIIVTEIIPTIIFCYLTNQWWILGVYYIWTAFIQEWVEHNPNVYLPPFSAGKTHLVHHREVRYKGYSYLKVDFTTLTYLQSQSLVQVVQVQFLLH